MDFGIQITRRGGYRTIGVVTTLIAAMGMGMSSAEAAEGSYPFISGDVTFELQNDYTFDSDNKDNEINDLYTTIEPTFVMHFIEGLTFTTHAVFEPVRDPEAGKDRAFDDEGLYLQDAFLQYETDKFSVLGGKFTPNFGRAWDIAPGIYGTDFAEDYEFSERIGLGGSYTFSDSRFGKHRLSASTFFLDTSVLSDSIITSRGRTHKEDGGPSNTESLDSFAISLDGGELPLTLFGDTVPGESPVSGLTYQIAFISQAAGEGSDSRENGVVASLADEFPIANKALKLQPLVEFSYFFDADGVDGQDRFYATAGATAIWQEHWNVALSYTRRETMPKGGSNVGDNLFQASAGYEFDFGLGANVGYRYSEADDVANHTIGALLTYGLDFSTGPKKKD
jgi:hypothetical protein